MGTPHAGTLLLAQHADAPPSSRQMLRDLEIRNMQRMESEIADLRDFFGSEADGLVTLTMDVNISDLLMAQRALVGLLDGWLVTHEACYNGYAPALLEKHAVKVAPDEHDYVIKDGRQFWLNPLSGEKLVLELEVDDDPKYPWSTVRLRVPQRRHRWVAELISRIESWIDEHHFLRGQAFDARGKIIRFDTPLAWDDVLLPAAVRRAIESNCIELLDHAPLYRLNGLPLKRGIILHGPPGTGKTMIGRALAQRVQASFIFVTPGMLEVPADVCQVFEWGRRFAPSILFFEDFDLVAGERKSARREMVGEFLNGLDGIEGSQGIIAIATTNDLSAIEPALKNRPNRFDIVLEIPALDLALRRQYLQRWLANRVHRVRIGEIAARTEGFTGAQMQELCRQAVLCALEQKIAAGAAEPQQLPLHQPHFLAALERLPARPRRAIGFRLDPDEQAEPDDEDQDEDDD